MLSSSSAFFCCLLSLFCFCSCFCIFVVPRRPSRPRPWAWQQLQQQLFFEHSRKSDTHMKIHDIPTVEKKIPPEGLLVFAYEIIVFPWTQEWKRHYRTWGSCFHYQTNEIRWNNVKKLKFKMFKKNIKLVKVSFILFICF